MSNPKTHVRARIAALTRSRPADDPELVELRRQADVLAGRSPREERAACLADFVTAVVAEAPPLTEEQIARITAILQNAPREQVS